MEGWAEEELDDEAWHTAAAAADAAGLYETELLENTLYVSARPVFRRCAAAVLVPLV